MPFSIDRSFPSYTSNFFTSKGQPVSRLKKINDKIKKISRSIFYFFVFWKKPCRLNTADIRLLKHAAYQFNKKQFSRQGTYSFSDKTRYSSQRFPFINLEQPKSYSVESSKEFDFSLKEMRTFWGNFTHLIFECFFEKYTKKIGDDYSLDTFPEKIKQITKFFIQIGNKSSRPIFQLIKEHDPLHSVSSFDHILHWLTDGETKENIRANLKDRLNKIPVPPGENLNQHYVIPLLKWFFASKHETHPLNGVAKFDQATLDAVQEEILLVLIEKKIDSYYKFLTKILGRQSFFQLLYHMFSRNVMKTTEILSDRLALIIDHAGYAKRFEELIRIGALHVDNVLVAKKALEKQGIPETDKTFNSEFANQASNCHSTVKKMIMANEETNKALEAEAQYFAHLADEIIRVLCPPKVAYDQEGYLFERDGIAHLWDEIVIPDEFSQLIQKGRQVLSQILAPEFMSQVENLQGTIISYIEESTLKLAKKEAKKFIMERLNWIVQRLTTPELRDELFAKHILPVISHQLMLLCIRLAISTPESLGEIAKIFDEIKPSAQEILPGHKKILHEKFKECMKLHLEQTTLELVDTYHIKDEVFEGIFDSLINDMQKARGASPNQNALECLQRFFTMQKVEKKEVYGNLIVNLIFEVGQIETFTGAKKLMSMSKAKALLSQLITTALDSFSNSHEKVISILFQACTNNYGTKSQVQTLLFGQGNSLTSEELEAALKKEFELIALLTHPSICCSLKKPTYGLAELFIPKPKAIYQTLRNIYDEMLKPMPLRSLLFNLVDVANQALAEAHDSIQKEKDLQEAKKISEMERNSSKSPLST